MYAIISPYLKKDFFFVGRGIETFNFEIILLDLIITQLMVLLNTLNMYNRTQLSVHIIRKRKITKERGLARVKPPRPQFHHFLLANTVKYECSMLYKFLFNYDGHAWYRW